ncbi:MULTISPECIES: hypothetical protein [Bradyrhizobium]|uniref:hypothetical protein n=1 Tax=Bradyrhizobium TaxID=374 RepID=UPI0013E8E97A|nr:MULTISPECIES: hypothetical protein [Bradyrhizobium]
MPKTFRLGVIGKRKVAVKAAARIELSHPDRSIRPSVETGELILTLVSRGEPTADPGESCASI